MKPCNQFVQMREHSWLHVLHTLVLANTCLTGLEVGIEQEERYLFLDLNFPFFSILADNYSQWQYMAKSLEGLLQFQLFGIPSVGPDVCGFNGNSDEELCNRWMMLGAFAPFMRVSLELLSSFYQVIEADIYCRTTTLKEPSVKSPMSGLLLLMHRELPSTRDMSYFQNYTLYELDQVKRELPWSSRCGMNSLINSRH